MFTTGETVGLAEWIIEDTCLVLTNFEGKLNHLLKANAGAKKLSPDTIRNTI